MAKEKTLDELNKIYVEAEEADREVFAEMRSNILLVSGEHYSKVNARAASNVRTSTKTASNDQKLRITKNHMHRVSRSYVTTILSEAPDTTIKPQRPTELQDKKDAELNLAVWQDIKNRHEFKAKRARYCKNFVDIGEVCVKATWNPNKGALKGYEQLVDEETGEPVMEETGEMQPVMDPVTGQTVMQPVLQPTLDMSRPIFSGDFDFEEVFGFNLLREAGSGSMSDAGRCWVVRKMVDTEELKSRFRDDPEISKKISESKDETYVVFDANKGSYEKAKGQTLLREFYWPPCEEYPEGWYVYATKDVKLAEDVLPFGLFPLVWEGFDEYATAPRGRSILKVARPLQAEINRASSQMALAQVTLGDDKILYNSGSKLAPGALLPGVRGISYQGQQPTILPGRNGAQYLEYVGAQVAELDRILMLEDMEVVDKSGQIEPYALLFKAATKKRKYSPYIEKFQNFQRKLTALCLEIAKRYYPDDMLVSAVGTREAINIEEFRKTTPLNYQIVIEESSDTPETQFGQQLAFQQILQYVGKDLDKHTRGKIIKNMPFANTADSFDDLTIDEDIATNDMLALERGQEVHATPYTEPDFMLRKLTARMKKPEYLFLPDEVKQGYERLKVEYEQILAEQQAKTLAAKNEYIPVDGALVTCDFYITDPTHPENQAKRAKIPQRSLEWLLQRLEEQGMSLDKMEGMNAQALAEMAEMLMAQKAAAQGQGQMPMQMQNMGQGIAS